MPGGQVIPNSVTRSLEALAAGERKNQLYYLLAAIAGIVAACGLIWWSSAHVQPGSALTRDLESAGIPLLTSCLSVTRIVACETKIAKYKAASLLTGSAAALGLKLIQRAILPDGANRRAPSRNES